MVPEIDREEVVTVRRDPYFKEREAAAGRLPFYAQKFPEAAEILHFYGRILENQRAIETSEVQSVEDCRSGSPFQCRPPPDTNLTGTREGQQS
jgi:hypothetical protein